MQQTSQKCYINSSPMVLFIEEEGAVRGTWQVCRFPTPGSGAQERPAPQGTRQAVLGAPLTKRFQEHGKTPLFYVITNNDVPWNRKQHFQKLNNT